MSKPVLFQTIMFYPSEEKQSVYSITPANSKNDAQRFAKEEMTSRDSVSRKGILRNVIIDVIIQELKECNNRCNNPRTKGIYKKRKERIITAASYSNKQKS